jgi:hypothetical protein
MVTNYDIDEIIFPRLALLNETIHNYEDSVCNKSICKYKRKYNLYDYAVRLFDLFGKNNKTACLMFRNVAFIITDGFLDNFMNTFSNSSNWFFYKDEVNKGIRIFANKTDEFIRLKQLSKLYNDSNCLRNKHITNDTFFDFDRVFAFLSNSRLGKSVLKTSLVETINQHSADLTSGYFKKDIPFVNGYVSHFRDYYRGFYLDRNYTINDIHVDIEYYLFLLNNFKNYAC